MSILATRELNKQVLIVYLQVSGSLSYVSWLIPRSERQYRVNVVTMKVVIKSDWEMKSFRSKWGKWNEWRCVPTPPISSKILKRQTESEEVSMWKRVLWMFRVNIFHITIDCTTWTILDSPSINTLLTHYITTNYLFHLSRLVPCSAFVLVRVYQHGSRAMTCFHSTRPLDH